MRCAKVLFPNGAKEFPVIEKPFPHILIDKTVKFYGWMYYNYQDRCKRECTHERWPLNPYGSCANLCFFCYARRLGAYARLFDAENIMTVYKEFPEIVAKRISKMNTGCCGYLSTSTDPFQEAELHYHYSEKTIESFTSVNLPIEFITKRGSLVNEHVYSMIASQEHSFVQFTCLTPDDALMRRIAPRADTFAQQCAAMQRARTNGVRHVVARFDPIIPLVTDKDADIESMFSAVKDAGATHVVMSCADIPGSFKNIFLQNVARLVDAAEFKRFKEFYQNDQAVGNDLNANVEYRRALFSKARDLATKNGLTFSMCMEFEVIRDGGDVRYRGFNDEFSTSRACEGIDTPIYYRENLGDAFKPLSTRVPGCDGNCLASAKGKEWSCNGACNCEPFTMATALDEKRYRQMWESIRLRDGTP